MRADGADLIRFLFTANRNTSLQPIEKVASGGEMSRLMLSLKALVAAHAQLPTIIFDRNRYRRFRGHRGQNGRDHYEPVQEPAGGQYHAPASGGLERRPSFPRV
ncbi:MAG: hypothetical protein ACLTZY_10855 [Alistipes indistinctus]